MYYSIQSDINCVGHLKWNKTDLRQSRQPMAETGSSDWLFWRWMTACWRTLCKRHYKHKGIKCHNARLTDTSPLLFSRLFFFFLFLESRVSSAARFFRSFSLRCWQAAVENGADDCRKTHVCSLAGHRSWELLLRAPERLSLQAWLNETPQPHTNEKKLLFPSIVLCSSVFESRLAVVRWSGLCLLANELKK